MTYRIPVGPFELHRRIGSGGMGEVWAGIHRPQQFPVAVKVLTRQGVRRETYVEAFRNEARGLAGLNHPGIVTLLDYGAMPAGAARLSEGSFEADSPYLVMELARGGTLKDYVDSMRWLDLKGALLTILDALGHAHAAGVIHRDLKPGNILVGCGDGAGPGIKVTDFGLAHALERHDFAGATDSGWGTPQFMAPEQFRGAWRDYGPWTDLYALGVMTYYLCTCEYPFEAEDSVGWGRAHQLQDPRPLTPRFEVPDGFSGWLERLLQKHPRDRFHYAADAAWALNQLGDPPGLSPQGATLLLPTVRAGAEVLAPSAFLSQPETARWGADVSDRTLVDRPETTRLAPPEDAPVTDEAARPAAERNSPTPPLPYTWRPPHMALNTPRLAGAGLGLFGLRTLPMVDRDAERDALWAALRLVRHEGTARVVVLRGPSGTGKSRLARWLVRRAHEVGAAGGLKAAFSPVSGPGDGLSRMVARDLRAGGMNPTQTLERVEAELAAMGERDSAEARELTRFVVPFVATSPEIMVLGRARQDTGNARYGVLARHVRRVARSRPVIVWFDDVQWGADALAFTQFVIEQQHHTPVPALFVLTLRDDALAHAPAVVQAHLRDITQNRRTTTLTIAPLAAADTAQLVRELLNLSPGLADEVERRCAGNPLFAVQLVGDWVAGGKLEFGPEGFALRPGVTSAIPADLDEVWLDRLNLLLHRRDSEDLVALEIASALGMQVDIAEWVEACAEYGVSAPSDLIRELLESGLAQQAEQGFEFCHGLFRESLERSALHAGRSAKVNLACVRMLERRYPNQAFPFAERYAEHVLAAGEPERAIGPLLAAARARLDRSEFELSLGLLDRRERLLESLQVGVDAREWSLGWSARATVALWQGNYAEAQRFASRVAIEARRTSWPEVEARAELIEGLAFSWQGDNRRAARLLRRAAESFRELADDVGLGEAMLGLGRVEQARGRLDDAEGHFHAAVQHFGNARYPLGEAQGFNALGDIERARQNWAGALAYANEARAVFEWAHNSIGVADCLNDIAELHRLRGELEEARQGCVEALRLYEALGSAHSMTVRINLALTLAAMGHLDEARQLLEEVRLRFEQTGQPGARASTDLHLVPILLELGESALARQRFRDAAQIVVRDEVPALDAHPKLLASAAQLRTQGEQSFADDIERFVARASR